MLYPQDFIHGEPQPALLNLWRLIWLIGPQLLLASATSSALPYYCLHPFLNAGWVWEGKNDWEGSSRYAFCHFCSAGSFLWLRMPVFAIHSLLSRRSVFIFVSPQNGYYLKSQILRVIPLTLRSLTSHLRRWKLWWWPMTSLTPWSILPYPLTLSHDFSMKIMILLNYLPQMLLCILVHLCTQWMLSPLLALQPSVFLGTPLGRLGKP